MNEIEGEELLIGNSKFISIDDAKYLEQIINNMREEKKTQ